MPKLNFTDRSIRALKPPARGQVDYFDTSRNTSSGLGIRVGYGGRKAWFSKLTYRGQQQRITHGAYPAIALTKARSEHERVKALASQGIDPRSERQAEREQLTFKALADRYIEEYAKSRKRTWPEDERILAKYFRKWQRRRAEEITAIDAYNLLKDLAERGLDDAGPAPIMANRARACVSKLFNWAARHPDIAVSANPLLSVDRAAPEVKRERVYSADELRDLWEDLGKRGNAGWVLRMCLITGQRLGEVAGMRWDEIDEDEWIWDLPAARSKNRRPHAVPLNAMARDVLDAMRQQREKDTRDPKSAFVFRTPRRIADAPVASFGKPSREVREDSGVADFRAHDLRRSFTTHARGAGVPRLIIKKLLNHAESDVTEVYDRYDALSEKREAMYVWDQRLRAILAKNVVTLASAKGGAVD